MRDRKSGPVRHWTTDLLRSALAAANPEDFDQRLSLPGLTLNHAVAQWAQERRDAPARWSAERVRTEASTLVAFLVVGSAPR